MFRIATGLNSLGIQTGAGVGIALAEWITEGEPGTTLGADFAELDVRRFHPECVQKQEIRRFFSTHSSPLATVP